MLPAKRARGGEVRGYQSLNAGLRFALCGWLAAFLLAGCGSSKPQPPEFSLRSVTLDVSPRANNYAPVAVDLVILADPTLVDHLVKMPAAEWFTKREQYQRDYPLEIAVMSWELVPGQMVSPVPVDLDTLDKPAWAVFIFANYLESGPHRVRISTQKDARVHLQENDLVLEAN
jgi:type VI secretion system protein